jgi:exodeoxyribonuclease V alpha subunit
MASVTDPELCILLNGDEEVGYGFDEPDELTRAYAVTIHARRAKSTPPGRPLVTSAWPSLQRTPVHYP